MARAKGFWVRTVRVASWLGPGPGSALAPRTPSRFSRRVACPSLGKVQVKFLIRVKNENPESLFNPHTRLRGRVSCTGARTLILSYNRPPNRPPDRPPDRPPRTFHNRLRVAVAMVLPPFWGFVGHSSPPPQEVSHEHEAETPPPHHASFRT